MSWHLLSSCRLIWCGRHVYFLDAAGETEGEFGRSERLAKRCMEQFGEPVTTHTVLVLLRLSPFHAKSPRIYSNSPLLPAFFAPLFLGAASPQFLDPDLSHFCSPVLILGGLLHWSACTIHKLIPSSSPYRGKRLWRARRSNRSGCNRRYSSFIICWSCIRNGKHVWPNTPTAPGSLWAILWGRIHEHRHSHAHQCQWIWLFVF